jgi:hypothetical protein
MQGLNAVKLSKLGVGLGHAGGADEIANRTKKRVVALADVCFGFHIFKAQDLR